MLLLVSTVSAAAFTVLFVELYDNSSEAYQFTTLVENLFWYTLQHMMLQSEGLGDQNTLKMKVVRGNPE